MITALIAQCVFVIQVGRSYENQGASRREAYRTATEALGPSMCGFITIPDGCRKFANIGAEKARLRCFTQSAMYRHLSGRRVHFIASPGYAWFGGAYHFAYAGLRNCSMSYSTMSSRVEGKPAHQENLKWMRKYL